MDNLGKFARQEVPDDPGRARHEALDEALADAILRHPGLKVLDRPLTFYENEIRYAIKGRALDTLDGSAPVDADSGYTMGAVFGREFGGRWRVEGEFRYRTNEFASVDLPDGSRITDGDFSSGALGVNGYWLFGEVDAAWRPFVGAGLAWMQEIDLDLADDPVNGSYSGDGTAWQLMGGVTWAPSDRWRFDFEARYLDAGSVTMDSERGALGGRIDADYSLFEVTAEATYRF